MTDRDLENLTAHLQDLLTALAPFQSQTNARISSLEKWREQMEAARTVSTSKTTWTALLKPIIIKLAIKMVSPHFYAVLTFLMSLIGRTLRSWLGW